MTWQDEYMSILGSIITFPFATAGSKLKMQATAFSYIKWLEGKDISDTDIDSQLKKFSDKLTLDGLKRFYYSFSYVLNVANGIVQTGEYDPNGGGVIRAEISNDLKNRFSRHFEFFHKYIKDKESLRDDVLKGNVLLDLFEEDLYKIDPKKKLKIK